MSKKIDLIQYEKELKNTYLNEYLSENPKYFFDNIISLITTFFTGYYNFSNCINNNPNLLTESVLTLIIISNMYKSLKLNLVKQKIEQVVVNDIKDIVKTSEEYIRLENDYFTYISSLGDFYKSQGMDDFLSTAFLYNYMLFNGYLSSTRKNKYNKDINNEIARRYENVELWGSRVATGGSVCRHMSAALVDLENILGNKSMIACVASVPKETTQEYFQKYIANHAICLISDSNNSIFGYCPTNYNVLELNSIPIKHTHFNYLECRPILGILEDQYNYKYISKELDTFITEQINKEDIRRFFSLNKLKNPSKKEIISKKNNVMEFCRSSKGRKELQDFYLDNYELLSQISEETEELIPITKDKVKQLVIKKIR